MEVSQARSHVAKLGLPDLICELIMLGVQHDVVCHTMCRRACVVFLLVRVWREVSEGRGGRTQALEDCFFYFLYTIATVFLLYHTGDMMYVMRRRKPEPRF